MAVVVSGVRLHEEARGVLESRGVQVVEPGSRRASREWLAAGLSELKPEVLLAGFARIDGGLIAAGVPGLGLIVALSSGVDHIDVGAAERLGVCVANQPEAIAHVVAEHAVMLALAAARRLVAGHQWASWGVWEERGWPPWARGLTLRGSTVGVVGLGRIGGLIALHARSLGATRLLYWSRRRKPVFEQLLHAEPASLERLFSESDFIFVTLPRARGTVGLIGYELLGRMRDGSVLVNVGRGGVVSEEAIIRLLGEGRDVRIALDVFSEEPIPPGSPLARAARLYPERLILTPHHAGASTWSGRATQVLAARQALHYLEKGEVWNPVNAACREARDVPGLWSPLP